MDCFSVLSVVEAIVTGVSSTRIQGLTGVTDLLRERQGHLQVLSVGPRALSEYFSVIMTQKSHCFHLFTVS